MYNNSDNIDVLQLSPNSKVISIDSHNNLFKTVGYF